MYGDRDKIPEQMQNVLWSRIDCLRIVICAGYLSSKPWIAVHKCINALGSNGASTINISSVVTTVLNLNVLFVNLCR